MAYKLKETVTKKQMELCGYTHLNRMEQSNYYEEYAKVSKDIFIPLEDCEYGKNMVHYTAFGTTADEVNPEDIEDLIEFGLVEEVELNG